MPQLIKHRALADDRCTLVRDVAAPAELPDGVAVIVPLSLWLAHRGPLIARGDVGVWLAPANHPSALADDIQRLSVIAIDFPQFTDGRGYSNARLLRERYRYEGELRAVGDIGRDQLYYLEQCGFDAFVIPDGRDARDALDSFADFSDGYQATVARTPWFRRRHLAATPSDVALPTA